MADERRTTIDILALVIAFFGFGDMFKTAARSALALARGRGDPV
ncbi:hypothetical protein Xenpb_03186 [Xenorhabdus sp. PB62.4]|nr:hypothetical protein [Xenorhabdus sp. PB62.4]